MTADLVCLHRATGFAVAMFEWPADAGRARHAAQLLGPHQPNAPRPLIIRMRDGAVISQHPYTEALHWQLDAAITPPPPPEHTHNEGN